MNEDVFVSNLSEKELDNYLDTIQEQEEHEEIIFYHQDNCGMCATIERMLKLKKIDYISVKDIETMRARGINHTPVLSVNGELKMGQEIRDWLNSYRG